MGGARQREHTNHNRAVRGEAGGVHIHRPPISIAAPPHLITPVSEPQHLKPLLSPVSDLSFRSSLAPNTPMLRQMASAVSLLSPVMTMTRMPA